MIFNTEHLRKVRNIHRDMYEQGLKKTCGYTFLFGGVELGENGEYKNHPLLGKKFQKIVEDFDDDGNSYNTMGDIYIVTNVSLHYENGYYLHIVALNERKGNSHACYTYENYNSTNESILDSFEHFKTTCKWI